jgi:hypothetical protein
MRVAAKSLSCSLLVPFVVGFTGCMMSPYDGQIVDSHYDPINFTGVTTKPGEKVIIQARYRNWNSPYDYTWETIAETHSSQVGYYYEGVMWYPWSKDIVVPGGYWRRPFNYEQTINPPGYYGQFRQTWVRALDTSGTPLATFDDDYNDFFDPNLSIGDMWIDHHNDEPSDGGSRWNPPEAESVWIRDYFFDD